MYKTKMLTLGAMALGLAGIAGAQSKVDFKIPATMSYQSSDRQTWNTVLLVSGIVAVVGLATDESTLTILGGAGVIVSLVQLNKSSSYRPNYSPRGLDFFKSGPISLGLSPFGQLGPNQGFNGFSPGAYVTANFKF